MLFAKIFFDHFVASTFDFDGPVGSIVISDANMDIDMPNRSWAKGLLFPDKLDQVASEDLSPVAVISFEFGGDQTPIISVEPLPRSAKTLSAWDHYERAMNALDYDLDIAIQELDACLCANPEPLLEMEAYYNLSAAIWEKFHFNERKGATIADDEYLWVRGCNICLRRALKIYENL